MRLVYNFFLGLAMSRCLSKPPQGENLPGFAEKSLREDCHGKACIINRCKDVNGWAGAMAKVIEETEYGMLGTNVRKPCGVGFDT
jgi:hypothetical protein